MEKYRWKLENEKDIWGKRKNNYAVLIWRTLPPLYLTLRLRASRSAQSGCPHQDASQPILVTR